MSMSNARMDRGPIGTAHALSEEAERYLDILQEWSIISGDDIFFCALESPEYLRANRFNGHQPPKPSG